MCVIFVANSVRPSEEMVRDAWRANSDGAGIAWRVKDSKGKPEVYFKKGITDVDEVVKLVAKAPIPFVTHFRIASVGGKTEELTHPFPIEQNVPLMLEGKTKGQVLFHNGHWTPWNDKVLDAAIGTNSEIPKGDWSDTRAMAWLVHLYGSGVMKLLVEQRGVIFGPTEDELEIYTGRGWTKINNVWCSNDGFQTRKSWNTYNAGSSNSSVGHGRKMCSRGKCYEYLVVGDTDNTCSKCRAKDRAMTVVNSDDKEGGEKKPLGLLPAPPLQGEIISVKQAEVLYRSGDISKSLLKKFRKEHQRLASKSPKAVEKARKSLVLHTALAKEQLMMRRPVGRTH